MGPSMLTDVRKLEFRHEKIPDVGPADLLVRVETTGICGSDLAAYCGTHPYKTAPAVLGHELCGRVVRAGSDVQGFAIGDRVCASSFSPCECCEWCVRDRANLCLRKKVLSHRGWHGSFAEYVVLKSNMVFKVGEHVDPATGALVEPLSIALHAVKLAGLPSENRSMVIFGAGNIGLCCLIAAKNIGFDVTCVDIRKRAMTLAFKLGAHSYIGRTAGSGTIDHVKALIGRQAAVTIVASGYTESIAEASSLTAPSGKIIVVSYFDEPVNINVNPMVMSEQTIKFSTLSTAADILEIIDWIHSGEIDPQPLITDWFPLEAATTAMQTMQDTTGRGGKIMLNIAAGQDSQSSFA